MRSHAHTMLLHAHTHTKHACAQVLDPTHALGHEGLGAIFFAENDLDRASLPPTWCEL